MCWNKGRLCWKIANLFYFCHLKELVRPETFGPYYVRAFDCPNSESHDIYGIINVVDGKSWRTQKRKRKNKIMFEVKWWEVKKIDGDREKKEGKINKEGKNRKYGSMCQCVWMHAQRPNRNRYSTANGQFLCFYSITKLDTPLIQNVSLHEPTCWRCFYCITYENPFFRLIAASRFSKLCSFLSVWRMNAMWTHLTLFGDDYVFRYGVWFYNHNAGSDGLCEGRVHN